MRVAVLLVGAVLGASLPACGPRDVAPLVPIPASDPATVRDAINRVDLPALHRRAEAVLGELVAVLPADHRARVAGVTLVRDNALGEVNAYATCDARGPLIAVGDGLLAVIAHLAMATATDELFETDQGRAYLAWLAGHGLTPPPVRFYDPARHTDRRKVLRQHEVLDEELAFIVGHELAHHYLGHLACNPGDALQELGRELAQVPAFNQVAELAADTSATKNLLAAGRARAGYTWTEDGALLVIAAFDRHHATGLADLFRAFERTHPFPHLRVPAITAAAELWHNSSGYLPLW